MINYLRHLFFPHHTNNHRAKILHHKIISIFIIGLVALLFVLQPLQKQFPSVLGIASNITVDELLTLTNQKRIEAGVAPLQLSRSLSNAATEKAAYMFEHNFWAHIAPDGTTPWHFIKNSGYEYQYAGENLARGFTTSVDVVNAWMDSPTHRENLLSPNYTDIGFAVDSGSLTGTDTILVVQEFGSKYIAEGESNASDLISSAASVEDVTINTAQVAGDAKETRSLTGVASAVNNPLIDTKSATFSVSIMLLSLFIIIFLIDIVIIERKKLSRVVTHNLDHIIYLFIVLMAVIIISGGIIL